jgi:hypothetical protein
MREQPIGVTCGIVRKHKGGDFALVDNEDSEWIIWTEGQRGIGVAKSSGVGNGISFQYEGDVDPFDIDSPLDLISERV